VIYHASTVLLIHAHQVAIAEETLGPQHVLTSAARAACHEVHTVRYGMDVPDAQLERLMTAHSKDDLIEALAQAHLVAM